MALSADDMRSRLAEAEATMGGAWHFVFDDGLRDVAQRLLKRPDDLGLFVEGIVIYHMVTEGVLAMTGQRSILDYLGKHSLYPGFQRGFSLVEQDEHRHIAFGVRFLRDVVSERPEMEKVIVATLTRLLPEAARVFCPVGQDPRSFMSYDYSSEQIYGFAYTALKRRMDIVGVEIPPAEELMPGPIDPRGFEHPFVLPVDVAAAPSRSRPAVASALGSRPSARNQASVRRMPSSKETLGSQPRARSFAAETLPRRPIRTTEWRVIEGGCPRSAATPSIARPDGPERRRRQPPRPAPAADLGEAVEELLEGDLLGVVPGGVGLARLALPQREDDRIGEVVDVDGEHQGVAAAGHRELSRLGQLQRAQRPGHRAWPVDVPGADDDRAAAAAPAGRRRSWCRCRGRRSCAGGRSRPGSRGRRSRRRRRS